jgi:type IV pilus assembly protein PilQ
MKRYRNISLATKLIKVNLAGLLMIYIPLLLAGCNSDNAGGVTPAIPKRINEILISDDNETWNCTITGNQSLTFTAINQVSPTGLLLNFPDTTLDFTGTVPIPPHNDILSAIEANEINSGDKRNTRILILLKRDRPYELSPDGQGLKISFPKTTARQEDRGVNIDSVTAKKDDNKGDKEVLIAGRLASVTATPLKNHMIVNVNADGTISDYQSFAIKNPARIVFDIFNLKGPQAGEQIISVASNWVKQIRYFAYADKIRLVLDTDEDYLTEYFSFPTASGLLIYIGRTPEPFHHKR